MKLIYKGKYNGDEKTLPSGEHVTGNTPFKEAEDMKKFAVLMNVIAVVIVAVALVAVVLRNPSSASGFNLIIGAALSVFVLFPHELLHAICFKEEVYLYTNIKQGMLFVTGPEHISKRRFIFMGLLPNIVFGFIPFIIYMLYPQWGILGAFGAVNISSGAGDYYNVWNTLTQVPKGAMIYNVGFHSYWYMPNKTQGLKYE